MSFRKAGWLAALAAVTVSLAAIAPAQAQQKQTLLNVSYDPTRELYRAIDDAFAKQYKDKAGVELTIRQSHGGSGRQARSVIDGLEADVVTLALAYDIDAIADRGLLPENWQARLPQNSSPYTSTIVFLVRKGNPKQIKDWDDLVKDGVQVITPTPRLPAARAGITWRPGPTRLRRTAAARTRPRPMSASCSSMCRCWIPARAAPPPPSSSAAWAMCCWPGENEAFLALEELGPDKFDIVVPSLSILAEPPVAVVDKIVDKKGTRAAARPTWNSCTRRRRRKSSPRTTTAPSTRTWRPSTKASSPRSSSSGSTTRSSAAGARRRRITSATAAPSTRSTSLRRNDLLTIGRRP